MVDDTAPRAGITDARREQKRFADLERLEPAAEKLGVYLVLDALAQKRTHGARPN
jgi:hypothetical protein